MGEECEWSRAGYVTNKDQQHMEHENLLMLSWHSIYVCFTTGKASLLKTLEVKGRQLSCLGYNKGCVVEFQSSQQPNSLTGGSKN